MAELKKRSEVKSEDTWRLEDMYATDADWQTEFDRLEKEAPVIAGFKGRLSEGPDTLLECLNRMEELTRRTEKVYVYSSLRSTEDGTNSFYTGIYDKAGTLAMKLSEAASFFEPELLALGREKVNEFTSQKKELEHYAHFFDVQFRNADHTLTDKEEALLAASSKMSEAAENIYRMLTTADMKFGSVTDKNGIEHELTTGRFTTFLESPDRVLRKNTYESYYKVYKDLKYSIASAYAGSVEASIFYKNARKHNSCMEASLFSDNVPVAVYKNLVEATHKALPDMYRYVSLRKKRLGVDELFMYDVYTPIVADVSTDICFDDAKETVLKALLPLGEDYVAAIKKGYEDRWIDVYENVGKMSGAYSSGCYDSNPYILLNYDGKIADMFTLAHELGHSMHTFLSNENQSPTYANYPIFLAEVASTVNEALLMDYLLKTTTDKKLREYLVNYYLEQFKGTMFRQTMFAEFEMKTHEAAEKGIPLTVDFLHDTYLELNKQYFGPDMVSDDDIGYEWSRIPHFYSAFYVYKYSTGFAAAIAFAKKIIDEGFPAVEAYKGFLRSGGSDYPIEILKKAGVDMSDPVVVSNALTVFSETLDRMESM